MEEAVRERKRSNPRFLFLYEDASEPLSAFAAFPQMHYNVKAGAGFYCAFRGVDNGLRGYITKDLLHAAFRMRLIKLDEDNVAFVTNFPVWGKTKKQSHKQVKWFSKEM